MNKSQISVAEMLFNQSQIEEEKVMEAPVDLQSLLEKGRKEADERKAEEDRLDKHSKRNTIFMSARKTYINKKLEEGFPAVTVYIRKDIQDIIDSRTGKTPGKVRKIKTRSDEFNRLLDIGLKHDI